MTTGSANVAFRAQLVLSEQRQLYDYWLEKSAGRGMPQRADLNPCEIARLLPNISLVDVSDDKDTFKFRLAGTRLRDIFDREVTGLSFGDIDWGEKRDYWLSAFNWTAGEGKPTQGVLTGPRLHKEHLVQYWMKLPLGRIGKVGMLLCWDYCQAVADTDATQAAVG